MTKMKTLSVLIVGLVLAASVSLAQETSPNATSSTPVTNSYRAPIVVQIGPAGNALIRGTVTNVGSDSLTVKSWGGNWTVKIDSNTKFLPKGLTLDRIKVGDFIGLQGKVNSEETLTVHATLIRDWTERKITVEERRQNIEERRQNKEEVKQIIKETPKIRVLMVETIDQTNNTLTAKLNGQTITVKLAEGVKLIDRNWRTITSSQVEPNDTIRVYGVLSGSTLEASVIRDISIPRK
jgi:hypothetical protein